MWTVASDDGKDFGWVPESRPGNMVARKARSSFYDVIDDLTIQLNSTCWPSKQSVFGRMFDFGTVTILSTGEGIEALPTIAGPIRLRNSIVVGT